MNNQHTAKLGIGTWAALACSGLALVGGMALAIGGAQPHAEAAGSDSSNDLAYPGGPSTPPDPATKVTSGMCQMSGKFELPQVDAGIKVCDGADIFVILPNAQVVELVKMTHNDAVAMCADMMVGAGQSYCVTYGLDAQGYVVVDLDGVHHGRKG